MLSKFWLMALVSICSLSVAHTQTLPVPWKTEASNQHLPGSGLQPALSIFLPQADLHKWLSNIDKKGSQTGWANSDPHPKLIPAFLNNIDTFDGRLAPFALLETGGRPRATILVSSSHSTNSESVEQGAPNEADEAVDRDRRLLGDNQQQVQWKSLLRGELFFLATMHGYRIATEASTREALQNGVLGGYFKALAALHGWSDGDGYYETYLGHPIQGAVAGYMWIHNDPKYRVVEFGKSRAYWMSRLRAYAWSYVEIEQFKVGLLSEATLGQISRYCCAYGFNDHVITSNGGLVWMVGEDAIDRYVVRKLEDRTHNVVLRIVARVGLNPVQGMANLMNLQYPWHRENRAAPSRYEGDLYLSPVVHQSTEGSSNSIIPKFEATANLPSVMWFSDLSCIGGSGVLGFRMTQVWQWSGEVGGCMLLGKSNGWSGDSLTFMMGPQWILRSRSRWIPHVHLRAGGQKITEEYCQHYDPLPPGLHSGRLCQDRNSPTYPYAQHFETTGPAFSTGAGLDLRLTRALTLRLADLNYVRTWVPSLNGTDFGRGLRFSMGVGLQVGTW